MTLGSIVDAALAQLPACPTAMALAEARAAAGDFCRESDAWRVEAAADAVAGEREYALAVEGLPVRVLRLGVLGAELYRSEFAAHMAPESVAVVLDADRAPGMDQAGGIAAVISTAPAPDTGWIADPAVDLPDALVPHAHAIRGRTLARLMRMRGRTWANATGAQIAQIEYLQDVTRARNEAARATARR